MRKWTWLLLMIGFWGRASGAELLLLGAFELAPQIPPSSSTTVIKDTTTTTTTVDNETSTTTSSTFDTSSTTTSTVIRETSTTTTTTTSSTSSTSTSTTSTTTSSTSSTTTTAASTTSTTSSTTTSTSSTTTTSTTTTSTTTLPPVIKRLEPQSGTAGSIVNIDGQNLAGGAAASLQEIGGGIEVTFGGFLAAILAASPDRLNVRVPAGPPPGLLDVAVRAAGVTSNRLPFRYLLPQQLLVSRVIPPQSPADGFLALDGNNFFGSPGSMFEAGLENGGLNVTFPAAGGGIVSAPIISATPTRIIVRVPPNAATGNVVITITNAANQTFTTPFLINNNPFGRPLPAGIGAQGLLNAVKRPVDVAIDPATQLALVVMAGTARVEAFAANDITFTTPVASAPVGLDPKRIALDLTRRLGFVSSSLSNAVTVFQLPQTGLVGSSTEGSAGERSMTVVRQLQVGRSPLGVAVDSAAGLLAVANNGDDTVTLISLNTFDSLATLRVGRQPNSLSFSSSARILYVSNAGSDFVSVIDARGLRLLPQLPVGPDQGILLFDPVTERLAVTAEGSNFIYLVNPQSGSVQTAQVGARPLDLTLNTTRNSLLVLNSASESLSEVDLTTGEVLSEVPVGSSPVAVDYDTTNNRGFVINAQFGSTSTRGEGSIPNRKQEGTAGFSVIRMPSQLNFPRLLSTASGELTGFALANLSQQPAAVTLVALTNSGARLQGPGITNPRNLTINPASQQALLPEQLFGASILNDGWVKVQTTTADLKGFFLSFDSGVRYQDGATESGELVQKGLLPAIGAGAGSFTEISMVNDSPVAASASLALMSAGGVEMGATALDVPAFGALRRRVQDLFAQAQSNMYLLVNSVLPLRIYEQFGDADRLAALNVVKLSDAAAALVFPQFASGGSYTTTLSVVNLESESQQVTVTALSDDGTVIARSGASNPRVFLIPGRGKLETQLAQDMGLGGTDTLQGSLQVTSSGGGLIGFVTYGTAQALVSVAAQPQPRNSLVFSHVAETVGSGINYFTGVALLNTGINVVGVEVVVYRPDGSIVGSWSGNLPPRGRVSRVLRELPGIGSAVLGQTGGYIRVLSTEPIYGLAIFGTSDLTALAAIPPQ